MRFTLSSNCNIIIKCKALILVVGGGDFMRIIKWIFDLEEYTARDIVQFVFISAAFVALFGMVGVIEGW